MAKITAMFLTEKSPIVENSILRLSKGMDDKLFIKNPLVSLKKLKHEYLCIISLEPPLPPWLLSLLGIFAASAGAIFQWPWLSFGSLIFFLPLLYLQPAYLLKKIRKTLKRKGYTGKIKKVSLNDAVVLLFGKN